jgi:hypothetical protein
VDFDDRYIVEVADVWNCYFCSGHCSLPSGVHRIRLFRIDVVLGYGFCDALLGHEPVLGERMEAVSATK